METDPPMTPRSACEVTQQDVIAVLERVLSQQPHSSLRTLARIYKVVEEGRIDQAKPNFLVQQLRAYMASKFFEEDAFDVLMTFMTHAPAEVRAFQTLSQETIERIYPALIACYGKAEVLFYLLCDVDRRVWAKEKMPAEDFELPTPERAKERLACLFEAFVRLQGDSPMASRQRQAQMETMREKIDTLEKEARRDRRELNEKHRLEVEALKSELATAKFNIEEFKRRAAEAERLREKEIKLRAERLQQDLAVEKIKLFNGWLRPAFNAEAALQAHDGTLFDEIDKAIDLQARYDQASGMTHALQAELAQCRDKLQQIETILHAAHNRHPMLTSVYQRLQNRIATLEGALPQVSPCLLEASIATQMAACQEKDLPKVLDFIKLSEQLGHLSTEAGKRLRATYHQRAWRWEDLSLAEQEEDPIELRNPELRDALRGRGAMMLFLDGHNMLNGLGRYRMRRGSANTHEKMRERLQKDIVQLLHHLPLSVAHLVWDGPKIDTFTLSDNVYGHYSGGEGEHRADRYILDQLKYYLDQSLEIPCILITDDNDFAGSARRMGAKVCRLHDFEAFMNTPYHG